jgi:enoyl-[acyl-carrier protein] reductase III
MNKAEIRGEVTLITGGTRGIGRAIAIGIAKKRNQVLILNYLQNDKSAGDTQKEICDAGAKCILVKANLNFPQQIESLFGKIADETDHIDSFIHCAALGAFKPTLQVKANQWDLSMNINTRAFLLCVQKVAPMMQSGNIIALSSLGSSRVVPGYGAIGPSKAALESLVRYLAAELAPQGIRVNCVSGGFIETDSVKMFANSDELRETIRRHTPAGRIGQPQDIAAVIDFLISPSAQWVYGQTIIADGGFSLK